jgi:selenide,water dikinase
LPLLPGAVDLVRAGVTPGGTRRNLEFVEPWTEFAASLEPWQRLLCADAQTSGGLVLCVPEEQVDAVVASLRQRETPTAAVIGRVREADDVMMRVLASPGQQAPAS